LRALPIGLVRINIFVYTSSNGRADCNHVWIWSNRSSSIPFNSQAMIPRDKALNLYNRFFTEVPFLQAKDSPIDDVDAAKKCALIAADEVILFMSPLVNDKQCYDYWDKVKKEIEKL
jgi:ATP sulfurylase